MAGLGHVPALGPMDAKGRCKDRNRSVYALVGVGDSRLQIEDLLASHSDLPENAPDPANRRGGDCGGAL